MLFRIEKEHNHLKTNISSQKDKIVENYRREYEKLVNRQNDLNKQLINMEERFKVRMIIVCYNFDIFQLIFLLILLVYRKG